MRLYVVYDRLAEESGPPWTAPTDAAAARAFARGYFDAKAGNPDEYWLFFVGELEQHDMVLVPVGVSPQRVEVPRSYFTEGQITKGVSNGEKQS
jgi:hypothetical protein